MDREYFTFMASFHRAAKAIKDPAERLAFYEAISDYALSGEKQEDCSELVGAMLELVYPVLERQRTNSLNRKKDVLKNEDSEEKDVLKNEDNEEAQKNEIKTKVERNKNETKTKTERNQNENETTPSLRNMDKDKDMDREKEKEKEKEMSGKPDTRTRFKAPSVDEVRAYAAENGYSLDAERFVDYYTSNGWKVGRNPMKDWKAAVRNWCKGDKGGAKPVQAKRDPDVIELTESQRAEMDRLMAEWEAEERGCAF